MSKIELFFGEVDFDEFDNVDPSDTFKAKGKHYWYRCVIDDEQICFYDTCGRHFPIALENVRETDTALFAAKELHNAHQESQRVIGRAYSKIDQLFQFWEKE